MRSLSVRPPGDCCGDGPTRAWPAEPRRPRRHRSLDRAHPWPRGVPASRWSRATDGHGARRLRGRVRTPWPGSVVCSCGPHGDPGMSSDVVRLKVDWIACNGYGVCSIAAPDLIDLDDWGYPIVDADQPIPEAFLHQARRAV